MMGTLASVLAAASCPIFPASFSTNQPVAGLPVASNSKQIIARLGRDTALHNDFSTEFGIPFDLVTSSTPTTRLKFDYPDESDDVGYPIPDDVSIENGGDRHALLVDKGACRLYELFALRPSGNGYKAGSGATWNMRSKKLRPKGFTSADAAGLPIYPLLTRYEEVKKGVIKHAIRVTFDETRNAYVYPATHFASDSSDPSLPRMGERLRLKKSFKVSTLPKQARVIATAMQKYGLIVADNGSDWFVSGAPDPRWDNDDIHELDEISGADFEVVDASSLR